MRTHCLIGLLIGIVLSQGTVLAEEVVWIYESAEKMVDQTPGMTAEPSEGSWQGTVEHPQYAMAGLQHTDINASEFKYFYIKLAVENPNNIEILFTVNRKYHFSEGMILRLSGIEASGEAAIYRFDCSGVEKWSFGINPLLLEFNGCEKGAKIKLYNIGISRTALDSVDSIDVKNGQISIERMHQNDRMAAFHQTLVSTDELKPNSMLETYMNDKFSHTVHYQLAKIVPLLEIGGDFYGSRYAYDVETLPIHGGVVSTYRIAGVKVKTEIVPLLRGRKEEAWNGVALYRISTEPATAIRIKCGEGSEMPGFTDNRAFRLRSDAVGTAADTAVSDKDIFLLTNEKHSLTVAVKSAGQTNVSDGDNGGKILDIRFGLGSGELLVSFALDSEEAKKLLAINAETARKEVDQHYGKLLESKIQTPEPVLDEAFKHAIITNEYVWLNPYGWMECIHHWTAMWHMQNSAAACWLGQEDRSKACLKSYSEKMKPDGQIVQLVPGGFTFRSFGGSSQFYLWQGKHYLDFTNDHSMREYLRPFFDKVIGQTYDEYDPDNDQLLGWGFQIGNQEDFIVTPYNGTTPTIEGIQMLRARADMAKELQQPETERMFRNKINQAMDRLKCQLWQKDLGRFIYFQDPDGNKRLDGQYHTFIYPAIYDITDPLDSWSSIRHLRDRLTNKEGGVYCSNQFAQHVNGTWGMQAGAAQQPWAAMGLASVGLRNEAYRPLKWIAEFVTDEVHKGSWPEVAQEVMPAYFSPPSGLYIQAMVEALFGLKLDKPAGVLCIAPSLPDSWPQAKLTLPEFEVQYKKKGDTYIYKVNTNESLARKLRWKLPVGDVASVKLNGKKIPYQVSPGVGYVVISTDTAAMKSTRFEIKLTQSSYTIEQPQSIAEGELLTLNAKDCEIIRIDDRAGVLSSLEIDNHRILKGHVQNDLLGDYLKYGRLGLMNFARRSFFIQCRTKAGTEFWAPVDITILPRIEAAFVGQLQKDGAVAIKIRNNTSSSFSGATCISAGQHDVFFDIDIPARSEKTYTPAIPENAIALLSVGDNKTALTLPDGSCRNLVLTASDVFRDVPQLNQYAAERVVSIDLPENLLRNDTEWKQWSAVYTYPHGQWANSKPVLENLNTSRVEIPQLPGVSFKINGRKVVPVSARANQPFVKIDLKEQLYKKIYLLVACLSDNHDMFAQIGQITVQRKNIDTGQARQIGPGQFVKKLYMPGDLDWWSPQSIVGAFSTAQVGRPERYGLLPLLRENDSDWLEAKPPAFPQIEYWASSISYRTESAEMNVIEVDLGEMTIVDSARVSTVGPDACLAIIAVSGETTSGVYQLSGTPWLPDGKFREPRTVFEITDEDSVKAWTFKGDTFSVAAVKPLFEIPTLNTLAKAGEAAVGQAVSPDFKLVEGDSTWLVTSQDEQGFKVSSGEQETGILKSKPFIIEKEIQRFSIAGADGTAEQTNNGDMNYILLRSWPDGEILRKMRPPGTHMYSPARWDTWDLIGRTVYLEIVDNNPKLNPKGFAWIGLADYKQEDSGLLINPVKKDLYALKIDTGAEQIVCRTLPFLAAPPANRVSTTRVQQGDIETIPIGVKAKAIYFLGMMNHGWDVGLSHWGEHPELREVRSDQVHIGSKIGDLEIRYTDGESDRIPLIMGVTSWFVAQWAGGPSHHVKAAVMEPFASRPEYAEVFNRVFKLKEQPDMAAIDRPYAHYYLGVKPQNKEIKSIVVHNNPALRGRPMISAITLAAAEPSENMKGFAKWNADKNDLKPTVSADGPHNWAKGIEALKDVLYTSDADLPKKVKLIDFTREMDAAKIRFHGPVVADMLSNIWVQNIEQIDDKFDAETGFFHESGKDYPWYGGYSGIGTWAPIGVYYNGAFGRCSDHFVTLALRCIDNSKRLTSYVDFCDKYLYFYRNDHDPNNGPPNNRLDIEKWPAEAGGHWGFVVNNPCNPPRQMNELQGDEEMDGHGATMVGRWVAWRMLGTPKDDWLTAPRENVYGKSRYDSTKYAAEFVCWLMDYTNRDVIYCEGEVTGWGGNGALHPIDWPQETDRMKILKNYADSDLYEPYPSYVCLTGLRCSAQMADAVGDTESAAKWHSYADRIQKAMVRLQAIGDHGSRVWKQSRYSVLPSLQDSLVQAWFSFYYDGIDPQRLDSEMTGISVNTLKRQLSYPYGHKPVLAMGYGMGWITKAALVLDHMDDAGKLLCNIAKYSYDKNMDYVDQERGIDWRKFLWLIPEGANLMPDGRWYRIGDLTNGANQGPAMHALELCAGIDDTKPDELKIIPRVPDPLEGIEVTNFPVLIPDGKQLAKAKINYRYDKKSGRFNLESDRTLPNLAVRIGPYNQKTANSFAEKLKKPQTAKVRVEASGNASGQVAWWIWIEGIKNMDSFSIILTGDGTIN